MENDTKHQSCCSLPSKKGNWFVLLAVVVGAAAGLWGHPVIIELASVISQVFVNFLKLVSLPIIFLSIVSTASGMEGLSEIKFIGKKVLFYTLLTTLIAATVAMVLFTTVDPVQSIVATEEVSLQGMNYMDYLIQTIPSNIVQPFYENQVIGVLFLAIVLSFAILSLPKENKENLHKTFHSFYMAVMKICTVLIRVIPIAIFAFVTLFIRDWQEGLELESLGWYLLVVMSANFIQAFIVLPLVVKWRGVSPWSLAKAMYPALSVAFFTKSSSAALPMAMKSAQERAHLSEKVTNFSLPLCTTINMNACAAFIYTTVLFVSMSHGVTYSSVEMLLWIVIATIAAIGNAGVPMGCYFLSGALLAAMNVPLNIMGVILPFYAMIDMFESAINVWSDACVTACVDRDLEPALQKIGQEKMVNS